MSYKLTILGSSSAIPTVDRNPSSQILNANERFFLIDCAEGTQIQLRKNKIKFQKINRVFISHLHGDHYFGLIGLISTMHLLGRQKELHIYAHKKLKEILDLHLEASNTELCYPLFFHSIVPNKTEVLFEDNKIKITTFPLKHGIDCNGFLFVEKTHFRKIIPEKIQEYNIPLDKIKEIKLGSDFITDEDTIIPNHFITKENRKPFSYAYCSDTMYNEDILEVINSVTLLYHEATFLENRKDRARQTYHSTSADAALIAKKAKVKNLIIGHFSQRYSNGDQLLSESRKIFPRTQIALQGRIVDFSEL